MPGGDERSIHRADGRAARRHLSRPQKSRSGHHRTGREKENHVPRRNPESRRNRPTHAGPLHPTLAETTKTVTYGATLTGIYLSVGFLFYYASYEKLITDSGTMPAALQKLFAGSFFASVPGDNAAWVLLGLLEAMVVVLLASAYCAASSFRSAASRSCSQACRSHCLPSGSWASPIT